MSSSLDCVHVKTVFLHLDRPFVGGGEALRLAVTAARPDRTELHGHGPVGEPVYRLPPVRYLVRRHVPVLVGIGDGLPVLEELFRNRPPVLRMGGAVYTVLGADMEESVERFGATVGPVSYRFASPWLALNQENHTRYLGLDPLARRDLLVRILVGNLLSTAKGVGVFVNTRLRAELRLRPVLATLKGMGMLGFLGRAQFNFELPRWWGLGKSVSRGFGIVERLQGPGRP
ncbi:MAG: hypothetical protein HYZ53_23135 [Planctomycetes bacterium]|nr:hypothetical protein [Planctomycetota bacterium]